MASESWSEWPFEAVIDFQEGPGIMARDFREAGIPLVRLAGLERGRSVLDGCNFLDPKTVKTRWAHFALQQGDILLSTSASLGRIAVVGHDAVGAIAYTGIIRMRPRDKRLRAQFIRYLLEGPEFQQQAEMVGVGSVIRHFGPMHLRQMRVRLPPPPEQRAIAQILGTLDDKIELNRRMNETLEEMARALFKSWFVDFDPVRRKAEGRDPGLPKHLADLFPSRFVDSELGEIPEGWSTDSVYRIANVTYGAPFASSQFNSRAEGRPLIRIRDLADENPEVWTPEVHPKGHLLRPGDIVVSMDGEFRAYLWGGIEGWVNQRVCTFVPKAGFTSAFVRNSILAPLAMVEFTETATTVIHLGKNDIDRFRVVLPTMRILEMFGHFAQDWYSRIVRTKQEARTLVALREALLPKLISGELRIDDADDFLAGVPA
jgi:type I restriction enzyme S subunit